MGKVRYQVVGGKQAGKSGRVLSRHTTLENAKKSAKRHAGKGYTGAVYKIMPVKKHSRVRKYMKKGDNQKTWLKSWITFSPSKGVTSHRKRR